jgi:predicted 2-oxoglutarate/Fe(II)-dependent dioxygenase YbiX
MGSFFRPHRDNSDSVLDPGYVQARQLSVVCFLNDGDPSTGLPVFDGGTLVVYVTKLDGLLEPVVIRPTAGSVVVFQADLLHEVRPVKSGCRYSAIGWIHSLVK